MNYPAEAPKNCELCPRLVEYRQANQSAHPDWFNGPVLSFGDERASLLIIGLAPGVTGANRTGRPFTGDWAGDLLYATLDKYGFSKGVYDVRPDDGLELIDAMITNAVRCVPPQNKPVGAEINTCRNYLVSRINMLPNLRAILCLGKISHDSTVRALKSKVSQHVFGHAAQHDIGKLKVFDSYHCSRYNTNTGRLTTEMFEHVFSSIRSFLDAPAK